MNTLYLLTLNITRYRKFVIIFLTNFSSDNCMAYPTVVSVMRPHQKESRKDQEPAGLSFSAK